MATRESMFELSRVMSSAEVMAMQLNWNSGLRASSISIAHRNGERTLPCGHPTAMGKGDCSSNEKIAPLSHRKKLMSLAR